ncbi:hypothetical protein AAJ76_1500024217 [Vairimorpha ceranae]|uniref:Uncharacterized protein n=1 Tax=Vairimorpha ceranae TaxID=40302 RepID=A0A0F9ZDN9_9MICR|nr:hypothetical protein AAJ76_1500024217 [Vairimorpha ceranae]KKO75649.1 hypothetical protein AAJ76_1500024217 [Vairimorpha ceranae]
MFYTALFLNVLIYYNLYKDFLDHLFSKIYIKN